MRITTLEVAGLEPALHGMRNPKKSWDRSDSRHCSVKDNCVDCDIAGGIDCSALGYDPIVVGQADMTLAKNLSKAGGEHRKYLRMIQVWADFDMPRYWWSEFDTYHFNTKNSESTMHKLMETEIEISDFAACAEDIEVLKYMIEVLKKIQDEYRAAKHKNNANKMNRCLLRAKRLLPEGFLQMRTVNTNYEEIANIYHQRKHHRLHEEWVQTFCAWAESLPYFRQFCIDITQ